LFLKLNRYVYFFIDSVEHSLIKCSVYIHINTLNSVYVVVQPVSSV